MPPEEPNSLVALWLDFDDKDLICRGERVFPSTTQLKVSWYTTPKNIPAGYIPIMNGTVFAYKETINNVALVEQFTPTKIGNEHFWRDHTSPNELMITLTLPVGQKLVSWTPQLIEAKKFQDRIAVFWLLYPSSDGKTGVQVTWSLSDLDQDLDNEIERLNRSIQLSKKRDEATEYDVALSFAGEDRKYVEEVAHLLTSAGVRVFYDRLEEASLWGVNLYNHLNQIYMKRAKYTIMFISRHYAEKRWTNFERESAQARAFMDSNEYILPVRFDDTEIPGMLPTIGYLSAKEKTPGDIAKLTLQKLGSS